MSRIRPAVWHAKETGSYASGSEESLDNAYLMATAMIDQDWSLESIAAMLGNVAGEGGLNPWRWESDIVPTYQEYLDWQEDESARMEHGYGMWGFTPASYYILQGGAYSGYGPNFIDQPGLASDGNAQTLFFVNTWSGAWAHGLYNYYDSTFRPTGVDISTFYYMSAAAFIDGSGYTLEQLTGAFELCYEKPNNAAAAASYPYRCQAAAYWLQTLKDMGLGKDILWLILAHRSQERRRIQ